MISMKTVFFCLHECCERRQKQNIEQDKKSGKQFPMKCIRMDGTVAKQTSINAKYLSVELNLKILDLNKAKIKAFSFRPSGIFFSACRIDYSHYIF